MSRTAIVTGASRGIGAAVAAALAAQGYRVFGTSRSATGFERLDIRDGASCAALAEKVMGETGRIDVLVNNAGLAMHGAQEEGSVDEIAALFDVNFYGAIRMTNAVLPHMRAARQGRIVHISSMAGLVATPFGGAYAASKHALEGYSKSLDFELRALGISSTVLRMGFMKTDVDLHALSFARKIDDYAPQRMRFLAALQKALKQAEEPRAVGETLVRVLQIANPRAAYPAGKQARFLMRVHALLPEKLLTAILRRLFGLA